MHTDVHMHTHTHKENAVTDSLKQPAQMFTQSRSNILT